MHIELDLKARGLSVLVFVLSFCYLTYLYRALPALFTIGLSVLIWILYRAIAAASAHGFWAGRTEQCVAWAFVGETTEGVW